MKSRTQRASPLASISPYSCTQFSTPLAALAASSAVINP